jgi:hypothetical protein
MPIASQHSFYMVTRWTLVISLSMPLLVLNNQTTEPLFTQHTFYMAAECVRLLVHMAAECRMTNVVLL